VCSCPASLGQRRHANHDCFLFVITGALCHRCPFRKKLVNLEAVENRIPVRIYQPQQAIRLLHPNRQWLAKQVPLIRHLFDHFAVFSFNCHR
jgi:hypothetical protein